MTAGAASLAPASSAGPSPTTGAGRDYDPDPSRHLGLAVAIARREWARCPARGCTVEDFEQEAALALCDAVRRYDPALGRVSTFMGATIVAHLRGVRQRSLRLVRFGGHDLSGRIRRRLRLWRFDRPITAEAVSAAVGLKLNLTEEEAHRAVGFAVGCEVGFEDLKTPQAYDPEEIIADESMGEGMGGAEEALDGLVGEAWAAVVEAFRLDMVARARPLEVALLERRLLRDEDEQDYLAEVGRGFGVSRERARQIAEQLRAELRHRAERAGLVARRAQSNGTMTDTSLSPPASSGPWADAAHEILRAVLRGGHHLEARRALRRARLCTDAEADRSVLVIVPDYAAVQGLVGAGAVALPGVRTRGLRLESGEVMLFAVPLDHLSAAMAPRWRRDVAAVERAYAAAGPRGEETGVLLTRVRSVVVSAPKGGPR